MATGVLTVRGVDVTAYVGECSIEENASSVNGLCRFSMDVPAGTSLTMRELDEVLVLADAVRVWGGQLKAPSRDLNGDTQIWSMDAASFDGLLDQRVIESGLRSGTRNDSDDVAYIIGYHASLVGVTYVSTLSSISVDIDYSGMTLRKALATLAAHVGNVTFWVDENKAVHWTRPSSAQLVTNGSFDSSASGWTVSSGTWAWTASTGPGGSGDGAYVLTGAGASELAYQQFACVVGRRYFLFGDVYASVSGKASIQIEWRTAANALLSTETAQVHSGSGSTWKRVRQIVTAPASAAYLRVRLNGSNSAGTFKFDNLTVIGETAPFGISTTPNGTTTFAPRRWSDRSDATTPINRVLIRGNGISGWRENAASIAYYGQKFEGVLDDDRVTETSGIDSRAAWVFAKYAFPSLSGSYNTRQVGLHAGQWQIIEIEPYGIQSIEWIASVEAEFVGAGQIEFTVKYGSPSEDLASSLAGVQTAFTGDDGVIGAEPVVPDTLPPAVPTGLSLATGSKVASDGTVRPYLQASWTGVADADLDAYEAQIDRGLDGPVTFSTSVSGTGGALAAGTYTVIVTGVGSVAGETVRSAAVEAVLTAGQRLYVNITAKTGCSSYRVYAQRNTDPGFAISTATTGSNVEVTVEGTTGTAPTSGTAVSFTTPTTIRTGALTHYTEDVLGAVYYAIRIRAVDTSGNESAWTSVSGVVAGADTSAPAIPSGVSVAPGYRMLAVRWTRNTEPDLLRYEVRWTTQSGGVPVTPWLGKVTTDSNWVIITGLNIPAPTGTGGTTYYVQVRAIDRSGNCQTSASVSTAVVASENPDAGWSNESGDYLTGTPTLLTGSTDVAYGSIVAGHLSATGIEADKITSGTLSLGGSSTAAMPDYLLVYNSSGQEIGRWDANGLVIKDPTNTQRQMRFLNGVLQFSTNGGSSWTTAISGDGIRADAITLGTAPGGHNAMPNSSFELAAYATALQNRWETDQVWTGTIGTDVNVTKGASDLRIMTYTY